MRQWQQEQEQEQRQAAVKEIVMATTIVRQAAIAAVFFADRASSVLCFFLQQQVRPPQLRQAEVDGARPMLFLVRLNSGSFASGPTIQYLSYLQQQEAGFA
jgi:hypothetical protein